MSNSALYGRLKAISERQLDDRTLDPGDAAYLLKVLDEERAVFDLDYDQIVQLFMSGIIEKDEAREKLGL
jgi:hypothetical protein